jgi:phosphoribosyl 1,2-cyclic phosphate phosphodiesterase
MADLQRVFEFAFNGKNRWPGYIRPSPKLITGPFQIGATTITPFPVEHGRSHVFGYLFSQNNQPLIAYFSDCKVIPEFAIEQIHGVRHLIVDALRHQPHPTHMCFAEALALAEKVQPQETWFTHLCHDISHATVTATLPPGVHLAYDGLKISA